MVKEKIKELSLMIKELRVDEMRRKNSDVALKEAYTDGYLTACSDIMSGLEVILKDGKD